MITTAIIGLLPAGDTSWCHIELPHVTLVFAGELDVLPSGVREYMDECAFMLASTTEPFQAGVIGTEVFGAEDKVDVLRLQYVPQLSRLRSLVEGLNASEFTDYKPHATVGPVGSITSIPDSLTFDRVLLAWGDDHQVYKML